MGITTGMMIADGIGIVIGIVLGKKIPERAVKWIAALIFIFFGLFGLYDSVPQHLLTKTNIVGAMIITAGLIYLTSRIEKQDLNVETEK